MKRFTGYAKCPTGDPEEFEFEVENDAATEDDICEEAVKAMWGAGVIEIWWEEKEENG